MSQVKTYRCILTGATGGIGRAMALQLARHSESLLLLGRNASTLNQIRMALLKEFPELSVVCLSGDLLDTQYRREIASYAQEAQINLLVNNAGINHFGSVNASDTAMQTEIIETNLLAPMHLTKVLLPALLLQDKAQIIQVGSIFGYIGYPGNAAYCASKFGLRGYAQALARELSHTSLKVKYLAPRATATAINKGAVEELNTELGVSTDTPEFVASQLISLLQSDRFDMKLGFPERLFVFLNQLFPRINDNAIHKQLPTIEKYWSAP